MRIAIFATHPVQYHVPIWRSLAKTPGLEIKVFYFSDHSVRGGFDPGFGVPIAWDVPLLEGYDFEFITYEGDLSQPHTVRISKPRHLFEIGRFDWVFIQGYTHGFERQVVRLSRTFRYKIVMRGEFMDTLRHRSFLKGIIRDFYLKWFYSHVNAFCYIGKEARKHLKKRGIPEERMVYSPYSVDDKLLESQICMFKRKECRSCLGFTENQFIFLFSGKMIPRKMPLLLAEAIQRLPSKERVGLILLGDGPQKKTVASWLNPILGSSLIMPGFVNQSELGRYFSASDSFVLPSSYETWGLVVNEAMQFGLPVIVSNKVGCRLDLVREGETGFVFQSGDAASLATYMQRMMGDPDKAREMGHFARQHISGFTIEASVRGILQALGLSLEKPSRY